MRIDVIGKNLDITPAMEEYADAKGAKLSRYYDGVQHVEVVVETSKDQSFLVEFRVDVEKHDIFVAHAQATDLYEAIDKTVDKMARQLTDFKEKLKNSKR
jgi:putative sigma-54 modulation protein